MANPITLLEVFQAKNGYQVLIDLVDQPPTYTPSATNYVVPTFPSYRTATYVPVSLMAEPSIGLYVIKVLAEFKYDGFEPEYRPWGWAASYEDPALKQLFFIRPWGNDTPSLEKIESEIAITLTLQTQIPGVN